MKIKFLRNGDVLMANWVTRCDCCGPFRSHSEPWRPGWFAAGDEVDPNELYNEINLESLMFNVDYEIIEYP